MYKFNAGQESDTLLARLIAYSFHLRHLTSNFKSYLFSNQATV